MIKIVKCSGNDDEMTIRTLHRFNASTALMTIIFEPPDDDKISVYKMELRNHGPISISESMAVVCRND